MDSIASISAKFHIRPEISQLLAMRGICDQAELERYFSPGMQHFSDPFALTGMTQAVARINAALQSGESIAVYGDYDADGICAVSILYLALKEHGDAVVWYIPEREEGYGLHLDAVDFLSDAHAPTLLITCDCGISAKEDIDAIKSRGIDVIVTDHHELPDQLPNCITVNPKQDQDPAVRALCGAGVSYKLIEALFGREYASHFLDIAAIATVADSVELLGENRDIVVEGLKRINTYPRTGIRMLLEKSGQKETTAVQLAFTVVPRINAAGRVGKAKRALSLFFEKDEQRLAEVVEELDKANTERQQLCEEMLKELESAPEFLERIKSSVLVFYNPGWQTGVIGIVASKLTDRYKRPVFIFCDADGARKGSGRSVEGINLFQLLTEQRDILVQYGGHSQAAGVTVKAENFDEFIRRACAYADRFTTVEESLSFDMELGEDAIDLSLAESLGRMEPFGVGNRRPLFLVRPTRLTAQPMKKHEEHLVLQSPSFEAIGFYQSGLCEAVQSGYPKKLVLDVGINDFRGRKYVKCILKGFELSYDSEWNEQELLDERYMRQLAVAGDALPAFQHYAAIEDISPQGHYGTLLVCNRRETLEGFLAGDLAKDFRLSLFEPQDGDNVNRLLFSPVPFFPTAGYERVVFLDPPLWSGYLAALQERTTAEIYIPSAPSPFHPAQNLDFSRKALGEVWMGIRRVIGCQKLRTPNALYRQVAASDRVGYLQFYLSLGVFTELGLLERNEAYAAVDGKRCELGESGLYVRVLRCLKGAG